MEINPSDMDVGQGFTLAEDMAAAAQGTKKTQQNAAARNVGGTPSRQESDSSQPASAAAGKTLALEAAKALEEQLTTADTGLKIRVLDDEENTVQVEVVDEESNKVLRKIPQDDMVKLAASMKAMTGLLLNKPA